MYEEGEELEIGAISPSPQYQTTESPIIDIAQKFPEPKLALKVASYKKGGSRKKGGSKVSGLVKKRKAPQKQKGQKKSKNVGAKQKAKSIKRRTKGKKK